MLIKAIIKRESNFNTNVVSKRGAVGLMQIMPKTSIEIAEDLKILNFDSCRLKELEINIMFRVYYISKLLRHYNNNLVLALSAYNAGIGNTQRWYSQGKSTAFSIKDIQFDETQYYVKSIILTYILTYKIYKFFYKFHFWEKKNK